MPRVIGWARKIQPRSCKMRRTQSCKRSRTNQGSRKTKLMRSAIYWIRQDRCQKLRPLLQSIWDLARFRLHWKLVLPNSRSWLPKKDPPSSRLKRLLTRSQLCKLRLGNLLWKKLRPSKNNLPSYKPCKARAKWNVAPEVSKVWQVWWGNSSAKQMRESKAERFRQNWKPDLMLSWLSIIPTKHLIRSFRS